MKTQRFGVEIETTGITRGEAANAVAAAVNGTVRREGGGYDTYAVTAPDGRKWKLMSDASIRAESKSGIATAEHKVEFVTPICKYADIETIQKIVRALKTAGAKVNESCGMHVHIDASAHTARSLKNLANIMASKENLLFKALKVKAGRERYCKRADAGFMQRLNDRRYTDANQIKRLWYNGGDESGIHYSDTRYRALNLHSVWQKGTVEWRCFNSTLHAGEVKTYIQLCLAINNQALTQSCAAYRITETTNDKFTFRTWLIRLGLNGEEYETARYHLLKNLEGNIAWRNGIAA